MTQHDDSIDQVFQSDRDGHKPRLHVYAETAKTLRGDYGQVQDDPFRLYQPSQEGGDASGSDAGGEGAGSDIAGASDTGVDEGDDDDISPSEDASSS